MRLYAADLAYLAPELTIVITAVILSLIDLIMPGRLHRTVLGWLAMLGLAISAVFVVRFIWRLNFAEGEQALETVRLLNDSYRVDDFANLFKLLVIFGTILVIFMSLGSLREEKIPHRGEYYYLLLPATLGAMVMSSSGDLITLFVGLELLSITSYILVSMKKKHYSSNEAAFKYVVTGSIASAFILYGMSFLYGMTGSTNLGQIHEMLIQFDASFGAMIYLSFFLMLAGFGFKIAAAPFHTWAPDVYQGSATPIAAFLSVVSKSAGFAILFRVIYNVYYGVGYTGVLPIHTDVFTALMILAAITMIMGNAMALRQRNMKRLLAYSGIANAGYLLVPISIEMNAFHMSNFSQLFYYLVAYYVMNIGAFAVIMVISRSAGHEKVSGFAGLYHRAPGLSIAILLIFLSLAGFPVTGGFFGKLYIILGTLHAQEVWLALIMMLTSVVSWVYYFAVIRQMFLRPGHGLGEVKSTATLKMTIWFCALVSLLLGIFPQRVVGWIESIFVVTQDLFIYTSSM